MLSLTQTLLLAAGASAAVLPRQASIVLSDLYSLDADVNQLSIDVSSGSLNSIAIAADINTLETALNTAINDAEASPPLSASASAQVAAYLQNTAVPDIVTAINTLEEEKAVFFASLLQPAVEIDLKNLNTLTQEYFSALAAAVPAEEETVTSVGAEVTRALQRAIADFSI